MTMKTRAIGGVVAIVVIVGLAFAFPDSGHKSSNASPVPKDFQVPKGLERQVEESLNMKVVRIDSITDARIRAWARRSNPDASVVVELAHGVYADHRSGSALGFVEDYHRVYGLCVDVKRFATTHDVKQTCWLS